MKKIINLALILILSINLAHALEPVGVQLGNIEKSLFGVEYKKETEAKRLKRIEVEVFGEESTSAVIQDRINKINETLGLIGSEEEEELIKKQIDDIQAQGVSYPILDRLENQLFGKNYDGEGIYSRLDRLENKVFNAKQEGDLNQRVERLSATVVSPTENDSISKYQKENYRYDDYSTNQSDVSLQLSGLENTMFRKTYDQDPLGVRLNRLERKIFQRDFSGDDTSTRLQRIQAASTATRTAKYYDGNKFQKYASTGLQLGTFVLMLLAIIL